ncbi:hypothetical protein OG252_51620 [Streptomyces sp. NBC_01352]|uniref:HEAT repeat domain-containing protein n=1 Tax=unclassified Streptomyces TaxID=2593676 RepID=UPI002E36B523|nr:HEAT repeat domain-containing protein [Streptomyces sp. NBC_01352]
MSEPAGTERAPAEVAGNTFHGPTAFQQGDGNIQYNYYGPDLGALRARWLQSYLPAARRAARDYHYPGVSGATPPLAAVYVRQQVTSAEVDRRPGAQDLPLLATLRGGLPANEVLASGDSCVVVAGPGGGKSILLRTRLTDGVEHWLADRVDGAVPVLLQADALAVAPLANALAGFVSDELTGLAEALPPAFFSAPPSPGTRWLVLVDGLDEIAAPAVRRKVLNRLKAASDEHPDLYRFVVATRPLPEQELKALGSRLPRYELQPFTPEDLPRVARGWFANLPDPDHVTQRFLRELDRTRLTESARIPLMASLLCQLHAAAPNQPLPASRGQVYSDFIAAQYKRQHAPHSPGNPQRLSAGLAGYGSDALRGAKRFLKNLPDLIARLAAERHTGNDQPTLDIVDSFVQRPERVPPDEWRAFLSTGLNQSGLLTVRAGEYVFLHQTFLEYLAARHASSNPHALRKAFDDRPHFSDIRISPEGLRWWQWHRSPPRSDPSYIGFLLDITHQRNAKVGVRGLKRLVTRGGLDGWQFIADLVRLGTPLPDSIIRTTAQALYGLARGTTPYETSRLKAAQALARLGDPRAAELLHDIARNTIPMGPYQTLTYSSRAEAARALAELGGAPHTTELLYGLARDTALFVDIRMAAAVSLVELGDARGAELLHGVVLDTTLPEGREAAAKFLADRGDPRAAELLHGLARDTTLSDSGRTCAAKFLAEFGDPRGLDLLHDFARDTNLDYSDRGSAAKSLALRGDPRSADVLYHLTCHPSISGNDDFTIVHPARDLAQLGDPRGTEVLYHLARSLTRYGFDHDGVHAAESLAEVGDPRGAEVLYDLARSLTRNDPCLWWVAASLVDVGDPRGAEVLYDVVRDTTLNDYDRVEAIKTLARVGDPRAAELLHCLARDTTFIEYSRLTAAWELRELIDSHPHILPSSVHRFLKILRPRSR